MKAMLSSKTRDAVSEPAFGRVCAVLPSWDALSDFPEDLLARIVGLEVTHAERKTAQIVAAAQVICAKRGRFDLTFLADWPADDAQVWLRRLPGVGPKVAAVVVNFSSFRKLALPVDRHLLRVFKRMGVLPVNANFERGYHSLMRLVPPDWDADDVYEFHWLVKIHGQTVCRHDRRACTSCVVESLCAKVPV